MWFLHIYIDLLVRLQLLPSLMGTLHVNLYPKKQSIMMRYDEVKLNQLGYDSFHAGSVSRNLELNPGIRGTRLRPQDARAMATFELIHFHPDIRQRGPSRMSLLMEEKMGLTLQ